MTDLAILTCVFCVLSMGCNAVAIYYAAAYLKAQRSIAKMQDASAYKDAALIVALDDVRQAQAQTRQAIAAGERWQRAALLSHPVITLDEWIEDEFVSEQVH